MNASNPSHPANIFTTGFLMICLSIALSKDFANIGQGLNAAKKVLTMYGIELPEIKVWKEKRKLQSVNSNDERNLFLENSFNRK